MDNKKVIRLLMECVNIASKQYSAMADEYMEAFHEAEVAMLKKKKTGKWMYRSPGFAYECSVCGEKQDIHKQNTVLVVVLT